MSNKNKSNFVEKENTTSASQLVTETPKSNNVDIDMSSVAKQLNNALTIDTTKLFTTLENGTEIAQKEYSLVNPIGKKEKITVYDVALIDSLEKINSAIRGKDILSFVICKELAKIQDSNKLEKHGFKSIAELGKAVFGFESSTVNHYVKIGKYFINDDYTVRTGLPTLSISHFIELNSLVGENGEVDTIINLFVNGDLVDGMSTKAIREVVKHVKNGTTIEDKSSTPSDSTGNTVEKVSTPNPTIPPQADVINLEKSFDNKVAVGQILGHIMSISSIVEIMEKNDIFTDGIYVSLKELKEEVQRML